MSRIDLNALSDAAAMCGQPKGPAEVVCRKLLATPGEFQRDGIRVAFDADMLAFEVAFHTPDAAMVDIGELLGAVGTPGYNELYRAEGAHGTQGMWVGARFAHGESVWTIDLDLEWWRELAVEFAAERSSAAGQACTEMGARFGDFAGDFAVRADGRGVVSVTRIAEFAAPGDSDSMALALAAHVGAIDPKRAADLGAALAAVFPVPGDHQIVATQTFTADSGIVQGSNVSFRKVSLEGALGASGLLGAEGADAGLGLALTMLGIDSTRPVTLDSFEVTQNVGALPACRFVISL